MENTHDDTHIIYTHEEHNGEYSDENNYLKTEMKTQSLKKS